MGVFDSIAAPTRARIRQLVFQIRDQVVANIRIENPSFSSLLTNPVSKPALDELVATLRNEGLTAMADRLHASRTDFRCVSMIVRMSLAADPGHKAAIQLDPRVLNSFGGDPDSEITPEELKASAKRMLGIETVEPTQLPQVWAMAQLSGESLVNLLDELISVEPSQELGKAVANTPEQRKQFGVSLRDVAAMLTDCNPDAIRETKKRWQNSRNPKLPGSLGKCAADNKSGLYSPSSILEFVQNVETLPDSEISAIKQLLQAKLRPVRNV